MRRQVHVVIYIIFILGSNFVTSRFMYEIDKNIYSLDAMYEEAIYVLCVGWPLGEGQTERYFGGRQRFILKITLTPKFRNLGGTSNLVSVKLHGT